MIHTVMAFLLSPQSLKIEKSASIRLLIISYNLFQAQPVHKLLHENLHQENVS